MTHPFNLARLRGQRYATIPIPISPRIRIASVSQNKIKIGHLRRFALERPHEMEAFRPHLLLGDIADLENLAAKCDAGALDLSSVDTAILVTAMGASVLGDIQRVVLWQTFAVPVYELLLSRDGTLLACECEAHSGWHLEPGMHPASATSDIDATLCACGRSEPRIVIPPGPRLVRVLAATA